MRIIILTLILLSVPFIGINAYAQNEPQKTWRSTDHTPQRSVKPLNLRSYLRGGKSSSSRNDGPTTRNPMQVIKEGGQLPITQALSEDVDYNPLRDAMRRHNSFDGKTDQEAELMLADVRAQNEANIEKQFKRRNEFYLRHGMTDEYTRAFLRTKTGRLTRTTIRKEQRAESRARRDKERMLAKQEKDKADLGYQPFPSAEDEKPSSRVVVPTAKPARDGTVKPFFYR